VSRASSAPRRFRGFVPALVGVLLLLLAGAGLLFRRAAPGSRAGSWKGDNVLFITVDTLRADRLPAYGGKGLETPTVDALAARGVLFERCVTAAPLTLPSHTTIFSGTLPIHHGVRDNGAFTVPAELPLLAELFHARGYATAAFVSAFVLDSRWKLNRGFDSYFDQFDTRQQNLLSIGDIERRAGDTVDAALAWLERRDRAKPFFLWIHLFDPHAPYAPPPPFALQYKERPYLGEIAYADSELGRLWRSIAGDGAADRTAVVFAGDHGESLGDHGEDGHGFFLYEAVLHVPLLFVPPGTAPAARRKDLVSLADVMPTVVELADLALPPGVQGRSLVPLLSGRGRLEEKPVYSESHYARLHFGWSELAAIRDGRYKLVESSDPELYDLEADPGEKENLVSRDRDRYLALKRQLASLTAEWGAHPLNAQPAVSDPESARKLASLGYLTGGSAPHYRGEGPPPSPRAKLDLYNKLNAALAAGPSDPARAEKMLQEILKEDPTVVDARVALANVRLKRSRWAEAIPDLEESLRERPADATLAISLAMALRSAGRNADAERLLENRIANGLSDARLPFLLGVIAENGGDRAAADAWFAKGLAADPHSAPSASAFAEVLLNRGDLDGALREADRAIALDPRVEGAHYCRGAVLERRGDAAGAFEEYGREVANNAVSERTFQSLMNLGRRLGRLPEESAFLEASIRRHPDATLPRLYQSRNLLDRAEDLQDAVELAESGLELASTDRQKAFACLLLADLFDRLGDPGRSHQFAERGKALARGG
jgi:arylsulfatase A-like enzyme/Tfp pilus assembly protein PilF